MAENAAKFFSEAESVQLFEENGFPEDEINGLAGR